MRLEQTSRLISMGEMASTLAHELNQPLAAIAKSEKILPATVEFVDIAGLVAGASKGFRPTRA